MVKDPFKEGDGVDTFLHCLSTLVFIQNLGRLSACGPKKFHFIVYRIFVIYDSSHLPVFVIDLL